MKIIFSNLTNSTAEHAIDWPELAALSNYYIKSQGFETIFFGDERSLKVYKNVKYDNFEIINNNEIDHFPKCIWSIGKLIALSKFNEPVLHFDMDLLCRKIETKQINNDIVCLHDEQQFNLKEMELLQNLFKINPLLYNKFDSISYNCGIVGGKDYKAIHMSLKILFDFIVNNYESIDKTYHLHKNDEIHKLYFYPAVLVEQIWLFQIIKSLKKTISTVIPSQADWSETVNVLLKNNIVHLMHRKNNVEFANEINKRADLLKLKY